MIASASHPLRTVFLAVLLSLLPPAAVHSAAGSPERPFRYFSVEDGLTQSDVSDIAQDYTGHLWLTTARGLNRFDGRGFTNYTIADGLPHNDLTAIDIAPDNDVWVGDARGGFTILRGATVAETVAPLEEQAARVLDIEVADGHAVAVVEGVGILTIVGPPGNRVIRRLVGDTAGARSVEELDGKFFLVTDTGLNLLEWDPQPRILPLADGIRHVHASYGQLWLIDKNRNLGVWTNDGFAIKGQISGDDDIVGLDVDEEAFVWVALSNELVGFDMSDPARLVAETVRYSGLEEIVDVYVDNERTLWASTGTRLMRHLGRRFSHYKLRTGDQPQTIWGVTQDLDGQFWFATGEHLLVKEADDSLTVVGPEAGIPSGAVRDVVRHPDGSLWVGVVEEGLFRVDAAARRGERIPGTEGSTVLDVAIAANGEIWAGSGQGKLFNFRPATGELRQFEMPNQAPVYTLDVADGGGVLVGGDDLGLLYLPAGAESLAAATLYSKEQGLSHFLFDHVRAIGEQSAWVGTEEGGLYLFEDGQFVDFGNGAPYADQTVYLVEPLANGSLVVGGEKGLYQFVPGADRTVHFNQMTGFLGLENNVHATYMDSEGFLWIGTIDGASRMDVSMPMPAPLALTPQIISMKTRLDARIIEEGGELENGRYGASINFDAVSLTYAGDIETSYVLQGVDEGWSTPSTNRAVEYPRIPPGAHRFVVRARYPGEAWSEFTAAQTLSVRPFLWQRPGVIIAATAFVLLLIRLGFIYRTRHIKRINDRLRLEVAERTKSIEEARMDLQRSNEQLSNEVEERRKAEVARLDLETRFRKAFQNAPNGMGLLDDHGTLFDANPALAAMFVVHANADQERRFVDVMQQGERNGFLAKFNNLVHGRTESIDEIVKCIGPDEETVVAKFNISSVRDDAEKFLYAVLQVQDLTESQRLTEQLAYQATYDELTGLLNRRAFEEELGKAWSRQQSPGERGVLLYMDLDQFKVVNDTSGHAAGDQLLQQVAEILQDSVRASDTVGRLGGDEFAIMLWRCDRDVAARIAENIRKSIEAFRFQWDAETYKVGMSIGGLPVDTRLGDISEIQQLADSACFTAKEDGRNRVHIIEGEKDSARDHRRQIRWIQRLREAMDKNRFAIFAQEICPLRDHDDSTPRFEILLRLRDPETRRLIPPGAFLPAAERYGLSQELDEWVVRNLIRALYLHQSFEAEHRRYWVNLSGLSVGEMRFASFLRDAIGNAPLSPGTINFEITETAVIRNVSEARHLIGELREMGCEFALDDFGSGLSSFGYLRELPVSTLKIDGMFIRNIVNDETDRIFVKSIIDIAHTLDMNTVCELIETEEMLEIVRGLGADYAQGYAVSRPFELAPCFPMDNSEQAGQPPFQQLAG